MFQLFKKIAAAAVLMTSFAANAGVIVDVNNVDTYVGNWRSVTWFHDLSDQGFVPGSALSANITVELRDDQNRDLPELATIILGKVDFQDGSIAYTPTRNWSDALGFNSLASLNTFGLLEVNIWSAFGDFYVGQSTLTVTTKDTVGVATVSESSSAFLFALGLLSLVVCRKKML